MTKLQLVADVLPVEKLLQQISADVSALEQVPEFPLDSFLGLLHCVLHEGAVFAAGPAPSAGNDRLVIRVGGNIEIAAAAVGALKRYACHENPS